MEWLHKTLRQPRALRPRTVRGQLLLGLIALEIFVLGLFAVLLVRAEHKELHLRIGRRASYAARLAAAEALAALRPNGTGSLAQVIKNVRSDPGILGVEILGPDGKILATSHVAGLTFPALSLRQAAATSDSLLSLGGWGVSQAAIKAIRYDNKLYGFAVVVPSVSLDRNELDETLRITLFIAILALAGCTWLAGILASRIARPLMRLLRATRQLTQNPEDKTALQIPVDADNEIGELAAAFRRLIETVQRQREQSDEALALLDSILENAPIGLLFFDRKKHIVRVNHFFMRAEQHPAHYYLGKTASEVFAGDAGTGLEEAVEQVIASRDALHDLEIVAEAATRSSPPRYWSVHLYPIHIGEQEVRWVGAILVDTTERHLAEESMRRSEKLAATGRLAASIAHEINNPLEAVTNLVYLIRQSSLTTECAQYAQMAEQELARVSEIVQQTLRFYKQSTLPGDTDLGELMDSVLRLYQGRLNALQIIVLREYQPAMLYCFAGEVRQFFNNLVANAVDAMTPHGGRLRIRIRRQANRVVVTLADMGCGIAQHELARIFEPFYTTKEATGTGLGLWVSAQIARKHKAVIRVRSRVQQSELEPIRTGTVFRITFPLVDSYATANAAQQNRLS